METLAQIAVTSFLETPNNFTGIAKCSNGTKCWYLNGKRHRTDGPAVECSNGTKFWWLNGRNYSEKGWQNKILRMNDPSNINYVHAKIERSNKVPRNFTGTVCHLDGTKHWFLNGKECSETDWEEEIEKTTV